MTVTQQNNLEIPLKEQKKQGMTYYLYTIQTYFVTRSFIPFYKICLNSVQINV
jgi:hypothetical protein